MNTVHCLGSPRLEKALKAGSRGRLVLSHLTITLLHHAKRLRATVSAIAAIGSTCRYCRVHSLQIAWSRTSGRFAIASWSDMSEVVVK
jgi:hypothetical protein